MLRRDVDGFPTLVLTLCLAAAGCAPETSVLLVVAGDLRPGTDADEISIRTFSRGGEHTRTIHRLDENAPLPQSLRIDAGEIESASVSLEVIARLDTSPVLFVTRDVDFERGHQVREPLCLLRSCIDSWIEACLEGDCGDVDLEED